MPGVPALFEPLLRGHATIFMMHRFRDDEHGVEGFEPATLDRGLAWLRTHDYELIRLDRLVERLLGHGPPLKRAVAFTIDDGYYDHALIGAPVFARYDCPVTTFVTTGFVDGDLWFWWDRIDYIFSNTPRRVFEVRIGGESLVYAWQDAAGAERAKLAFIEWCLRAPDPLKHQGIAACAAAAEVDLPGTPPARFRPMSWAELCEAERGGMSFAPHTVTHPILSNTDSEQSRRELTDSWQRLRAHATDPLPVFAYPNGGLEDFGAREVKTLEGMGITAAVTGAGGYADARAVQADSGARYMLPRYGVPGDLPRLIKCVTGVERLRRFMRPPAPPGDHGRAAA